MTESYKKTDDIVLDEADPYDTFLLNRVDDNSRDLYRRGSHVGGLGLDCLHRDESNFQAHRPICSVSSDAHLMLSPWWVTTGVSKIRVRQEVRVAIGGKSEPEDIDEPTLGAMRAVFRYRLGGRGIRTVEVPPVFVSDEYAWQVIETEIDLTHGGGEGFEPLMVGVVCDSTFPGDIEEKLFEGLDSPPASGFGIIDDAYENAVSGNTLWTRHPARILTIGDPIYENGGTPAPAVDAPEITCSALCRYSGGSGGAEEYTSFQIVDHLSSRFGAGMTIWPPTDDLLEDGRTERIAKMQAIYVQFRGLEIESVYDEEFI